jgi:hypothetical protein
MWQTGSTGLAEAAYCEVHMCCAPGGAAGPGGEARMDGLLGTLRRAALAPGPLAGRDCGGFAGLVRPAWRVSWLR